MRICQDLTFFLFFFRLKKKTKCKKDTYQENSWAQLMAWCYWKGKILFRDFIHPAVCWVFLFHHWADSTLFGRKVICQRRVFGWWVGSSAKVMSLKVWCLESAQQRLWNGSEKEEQDTPVKVNGKNRTPLLLAARRGWSSSLSSDHTSGTALSLGTFGKCRQTLFCFATAVFAFLVRNPYVCFSVELCSLNSLASALVASCIVAVF